MHISASPQHLLLNQIEEIARSILQTALAKFVYSTIHRDFMKALQELMVAQKQLVVGNTEADDLLTKLLFVFSPVSRLAESLVSTTQQDFDNFFAFYLGIHN